MDRETRINANFCERLDHSGITMYSLAKQAGTAYTTVNELWHGKLNINKCSIEVICRLAAVLGTNCEELMNPFSILNGISRTYKKIRYHWFYDQTMKIRFRYQGEEIVLDSYCQMNIPERYPLYVHKAEMMIDRFLKKKVWLKKAERYEKEG